MKIWSTFFLLLFSLASCEIPRQAQFTTPVNDPIRPLETLLPFPLKAHDRNVEIYFSGVSSPAKPFLQLKYLIQIGAGHEDIQPLLDQLQKRAQAYGADGIIMTNVTRRYQDTWRGEVFVQNPLTDVEALAFVYPESISFIPDQLKAWVEYTHIDSLNNWEEVCRQEFTLKGAKIASDGKINNLNWWLRRRHDNLVNNPNIKRSTVFDAYNRPSRRYPADVFKVRISYVGNTPLVDEIRLDYAPAIERIQYIYEEDKSRLKKRVFKTSVADNLTYEEIPIYDDSGNVKYFIVNRILAGVKKPHFKIEPEYYTEQEFDEMLAKAIKEELGDLEGY